jgi:hypothetical protein
MQAGKSDVQMERFRTFLPSEVSELKYPPHLLTDDSPMREYLALEVFRSSEGVWFIDHDTFLQADATSWFETADVLFSAYPICLCSRTPLSDGGVTQPAYWLSPSRWPSGLSSFDPVPFKAKPYTRRPDLQRHQDTLVIPGKDTLMKVREELEDRQLVGTFPLEPEQHGNHFLPIFPAHQHIGGLHLYTGLIHPPCSMPQAFFHWRRYVVSNFEKFFRHCPKKWLEIEEPELLRRHREFVEVIEESPNQ